MAVAAFAANHPPCGLVHAVVVGGVDVMLIAAVTAAVPVTLTEEGTLQAARCWAEFGYDISEQDRYTVPVKPFSGVIVTVEVLPLVAPAWNEAVVAAIANGAVIVTGTVAVTGA